MIIDTPQRIEKNRRFVGASGSHIGLLRPENQDLIHPSEGDGAAGGLAHE